jgi:ABC-2 type transport system ATP-binding protein
MTKAARQRDDSPVLDARGLRVRFPARGGAGVTARDGVNVSARRGEGTGFVGPDGAGKTTLLRAAVGLVVPTAGTLTVLGLDATRDIDVTRGRIGYMPQRFGLYEDLTVTENLDLYADLQSVPPGERAERYRRLMNMTGLGDFKRRLAGRLSGGMKQKLGLACCLVKSPDMLVLDEPTVGVDPVSRRDLWQIVYELVERDRIGVVLSTAYLDEAERCHHVVLMHQGRLLDQGPPAEFQRQVDGRVYRVEPAAGRHPRDIQAALSRRAVVLDATLHSGRIRIVLTPDAALPPALALGGHCLLFPSPIPTD